ncbi:deoxyribonuclease gamma-like isoform X3 [Phycodurus eques]|uniref:deoxyribonuclease gamma-like isoform X3 n=1 Tax=Phycodurus eques TaxID=693459 RepID=UPI002ACD5E30|nr:deoxyribonuclease gamma-like isoform X3 [Phycodurus eques]
MQHRMGRLPLVSQEGVRRAQVERKKETLRFPCRTQYTNQGRTLSLRVHVCFVSQLIMRGGAPHHCFLLAVLCVVVGCRAVSAFRICAYNVQKLDSKKVSNYRVLHTLTRVLSRCDITLLQGVEDSDGFVVKTLLASLNREAHRYEGYHYGSVSSSSLGKSTDGLQKYVFTYRTETVHVMGQHQYQNHNQFVRAPFAVYFHSNTTAVKNFILVGLHADPSNAVQEIDHLYDVFKQVLSKWNDKNVMFLGDFHAGCAYMTRRDKKNIRLFTNSSFSWLIGGKIDTTITDETSCAYDRIVVYGKSFLKAITPFSANVFSFAREFKLTRTTALEVSDHLPVEVRLKNSALLLQATSLRLLLTVTFCCFLLSL